MVLLALFAGSTLYWIFEIINEKGRAIPKAPGYIYVLTTVAGLVSALVIAQLSVTKPGSTPGLGGLTPESTAGIYITNTIVALYLVVWVVTGLSALIVGVMIYPDNNKTISDLGTMWLGLAVSAAYAYFGISPADPDKNAESAKKALSPATTEASSVGDQLQQKIDAGQIVFDPGKPELKEQLLKTNSGTQITAKLQVLVLELSKISPKPIRISDLVRTSGDSHHVSGRAVDIGNEDIARDLLPLVVTKVAQLSIDEIIFDAAVAGEVDRNKWNYDAGSKHDFSPALLDQHKNHIHFSAVA